MSAPAGPTVVAKPLYTARATATGGRAGHAVTDDGLLDVHLKPPKEMGGPGGATNPEQLFAAGYAACFQSALGVVGRRAGVDTEDSLVEADVSIGPIGGGLNRGYLCKSSAQNCGKKTRSSIKIERRFTRRSLADDLDQLVD